MDNSEYLYPVYKVHDKESGYQAEASRPFRIADPNYRGKGLLLQPANLEVHFQAYTDKNIIVFNTQAKIGYDNEPGEMMLLFDPDLSHRKNHNVFLFRIGKEMGIVYQEYRYELETMDMPPGVGFSQKTEDGNLYIRLSLPLALLRLNTEERRAVGFNAVYIPDPAKGVQMTWSGIKGDNVLHGWGTGVLLFTKGMPLKEIERAAEEIGKQEHTYFTRRIKRKVPAEILDFVQEKKKGLTIRMNEEDVRKARENAENTPWGRAMKQGILQIADYWADKSDDELFDLVPAENPRSVSPNVHFGDPIEGGKRAFQFCLERPYQYYNPKTKTWWYNGMMIRNPSTGEEIEFRDDGDGFVAPEGFPDPGVRYLFTACYRLFVLSMLLGGPRCPVLEDRTVCPETTGERNAGALSNLAYAYVLTQDPKYAHKALILFGRIAELVPYMNGTFNQYDTVQIAEPTTSESHWLSNFFDALDLLYDKIDDLSPQLAELLARKPDAEGMTRTEPFSVKKAVLDMIPSVLYSCEIEKHRSADWSLRWIYLELIIASYMESGKLMHHILYEGPHSLQSKMRNSFFRDGRYTYDSYHYINHICEQMAMMANNTYRFRDDVYFPEGIDLFEDQEFALRPVMELFSKLKCGYLTPMFGDFADIQNKEPIAENRKQGKFEYHPSFEIFYRRMKSIRPVIGSVLAQYEPEELAAERLLYVTFRPQKHALLLLATAAEWEEYQQVKVSGREIQSSYLMEDSETSVFRTGTNPYNCKHVILYGQPTAGHAHGDKLGLWIGAYGYHLLTGIGGYPFTWVSPKWHDWEEQSAACTAVIVDGKNQEESYSRLKCHYEGDILQVSGMENMTSYPGTQVERWIGVVQAPNKEDAYIVDLNNLAGGGTFDYNTIGLDSSFDQIRFEGIDENQWIQMSGTMAGEDVPLYSQPGYGWMKAVKKMKIKQPVSWTYRYAGAALKIHTIPDGEERELVCSLGERGGQEPGKSYWEPFVIWRDASDDADRHMASFFTVFEPFDRQPFIRSVRALELVGRNGLSKFKPAGIEVRYPDDEWKDIFIRTYGEGDFVSYRDSDGSVYETDAQMLVLRFRSGRLLAIEAIGYTVIGVDSGAVFGVSGETYRYSRKQPSYKGKVTSVEIDSRTIQVDLDDIDDRIAEQLAGMIALIDSPDYVKPSSYLLKDPQLDGRLLTFRSNLSFIKLEEDWPLPHKRRGLGHKQVVQHNGKRVYVDVKPGDTFTLPNWLRQGPAHSGNRANHDRCD